jgi:hypothetical protein
MKKSTKLLLAIFGLGIVYTLYKTLSGHGGSGLYDGLDAISNSSIVLFTSALIILLYNIKRLKSQGATLLFLLIGLPLTIIAVSEMVEKIHYNRTPDLSPIYPRPIGQDAYKFDSLNIQSAVDSWVNLMNMNQRDIKLKKAYIDTIIYSESGDKVFVPFYMEYEKNSQGRRFVTSAFFANEKDSAYWKLEEARYLLSVDFRDSIILKKEVRKFYFNQFKFAEKDSLDIDYFWEKMTQNMNTIIVN